MSGTQDRTPDGPPPDPSCHITDTTSDAKATFAKIPAPLKVVRDLGGALFRLGYVTSGPSPIEMSNSTDVAAYEQSLSNPPELIPPGGGTVVWYIDTPPSGTAPMHRTTSVDFVILLQGELELIMEDGEVRSLKPGDLVVQRATMHAWRNPSSVKWARMVAVMSESKPVVAGGETLAAYFPPPPE